MVDYLLEVGRNQRARALLKKLGLPLSLPEALERAQGPWEEKPLAGRTVVLGRFGSGLAGLEAMLTDAGATVDSTLQGHPWTALYDATGLLDVADLRAVYDFFHATAPALARSGRALLVGRSETETVGSAAAQAALEGFTRSLAKELGRKGATAQLLRVAPRAEGRLPGALRFFASPRSAFVSGQVVEVSTLAAGEPPRRFSRSLEGKIALVTGAARGIGAATANALAEEGAHVLVVDRPEDEAAAMRVARNIGGSALAMDIAAANAPRRLSEFMAGRNERIDVLVHNAGVTRDRTLARMSAEEWTLPIDVNLAAVLRLTDTLLHGTLAEGGRIIVLSSIAGLAGNFGQTSYAASKAGLVGFVRALAPSLAPRGITINAVAPGFIETRMTAAVPFTVREAGRRLSSLGQGGQPQDVAQVVTFLASGAGLGVTGSVLRVCGQAMLGA